MSSKNNSKKSIPLALILDLFLLIIFAVWGRGSHRMELDFAGIFETFWPFAVGLVAGWLIARVWRKPLALTTGVIIALCVLVIGQGLRIATGLGTFSWIFVAIACTTLLIFFVGWRLVAAGIAKLNSAPRRD